MNQDYIIPDSWSIIEEGYEDSRVKSSESLFSLGNGAMGQRANFEEDYSGSTFQGSYIGGVYYPDKTRDLLIRRKHLPIHLPTHCSLQQWTILIKSWGRV